MVTKWEVEYTDEFGDWWCGLEEAEQESIDATVRLLESAGPFAFCTHSTHAVAPFCSLAAIKPEMVAGTCTTFRLQTGCMTNT